MKEYKKTELSAVNILSLILVAVGFLTIAYTITIQIKAHSGQGVAQELSMSPSDVAVAVATKENNSVAVTPVPTLDKSGLAAVPFNYYLVRYLLGMVFILLGVSLHLLLRKVDDPAKVEEGDSKEEESKELAEAEGATA